MAGQINWFPGHMAKARRQMEENLKKVDFIIEIRDARIPASSRNPMLEQIAGNKPRLIILSKKDKADENDTRIWTEALSRDGTRVMALDQLHENFRNKLVSSAKELCQPLIDKQIRRGMKPRALRAMVVGIPNVGKSTFINTLARRKAAATGDRPGVTKSLQWINLTSDLQLLDTPGVLWPKFDDELTGKNLALLGSIRDTILTMDDLAYYAADYLMKHHPEALKQTYQIELGETPWQTLENMARKRGYLQKGAIDENRMVNSFVKDIRENKLGRITWEMPDAE